MKAMIFNQGKGWYITAKNYKDPEDKCYINVYFPQKTDPVFTPHEKGWANLYVDIQQAKFTSYKNKPELTVFAYEVISKDEPVQPDVKIEEAELPFY